MIWLTNLWVKLLYTTIMLNLKKIYICICYKSDESHAINCCVPKYVTWTEKQTVAWNEKSLVQHFLLIWIFLLTLSNYKMTLNLWYPGIYIIITKNIRYLLWNRGAWRFFHDRYLTIEVQGIRCTNHLHDSCPFTDVNPHFTAPGGQYYFKINSWWPIVMS